MSGIVGILIGAAVLAHYGHPNLSSVGQLSSSQLFKSIAYVSETFVFIYLGIALTSFNHKWDTMTVLTAIIFTLFSRLANIFPLAAVINMYRNEDRISGKTQFIMWFSGLRGAIAFALSLNFPGGNELTRRVVISTTLVSLSSHRCSSFYSSLYSFLLLFSPSSFSTSWLAWTQRNTFYLNSNRHSLAPRQLCSSRSSCSAVERYRYCSSSA